MVDCKSDALTIYLRVGKARMHDLDRSSDADWASQDDYMYTYTT